MGNGDGDKNGVNFGNGERKFSLKLGDRSRDGEKIGDMGLLLRDGEKMVTFFGVGDNNNFFVSFKSISIKAINPSK